MPDLNSDLLAASPREYISSESRGQGGNWMAPGSKNCMATKGKPRAFRGVDEQVGKIGGRLYFTTDASYASLGDATTPGTGDIYTVKQLLSTIGTGQVCFNGAIIPGYVASSILSFLKKSAGVYAPGTLTGPFQAGHAQPSAPSIFAKSTPGAGKSAMSGAIAVKIWRVSGITGQISLASAPSNVLTLSDQTCIVQIPLVDTNGQDTWGFGAPKVGFLDLGNFYELPTEIGGEVAESVLAYTRSAGACSIGTGTTTVTVGSNDATSADIGRRISFGGFDSWITSINNTGSVEVNDTAGANYSGAGTVTHAVDGYTRAVEISWTNGHLQSQPLVPDKAFPPVAGEFGGFLNDTGFIEAGNIIYVGEPGFIGSYPPSNAIFPNEPAVHYLRASDDVYVRAGKHSVGVIAYMGGSPALEFQVLWENVGILFPQNIAVGYGGRVMIYSGKPMVLQAGQNPDSDFASKVFPDFEGWNSQTVDAPVCPGFDSFGMYEVWCYQKKIMAQFVPTGEWCAPADLTDLVIGDVVGCVTFENKLYLACSDGAQVKLYQFDAGTGSVMVVQTDDYSSREEADNINYVYMRGRVDNVANNVKVELIVDFDDDNPELVSDEAPPDTGTLHFDVMQPNIIDVGSHALRITMTSQGGDVGIDALMTKGSTSGVI